MDATHHPHIEEFDRHFTNNRIQILKVLLPYLDEKMQKIMAVYIKFSEFQTVLRRLQSTSRCVPFFCIQKEPGGLCDIISEISSFCSTEEKEHFGKILSAYENFERYKELMNTMELFSDLMPKDGSENLFSDTSPLQGFFNMGDTNAGGMSDLLMNMLSPEQKELFEMFGGIQNAE